MICIAFNKTIVLILQLIITKKLKACSKRFIYLHGHRLLKLFAMFYRRNYIKFSLNKTYLITIIYIITEICMRIHACAHLYMYSRGCARLRRTCKLLLYIIQFIHKFMNCLLNRKLYMFHTARMRGSARLRVRICGSEIILSIFEFKGI